MVFSSIQIEKGESLHAAVNAKSGKVYISYPFDRRVLSVDTDSKCVDGAIEVHGVGNISINPVTNILYIRSHNGIDVIDGSTNKHVNTINGKPRLRGTVSLNPLTNTIYSTNLDQCLTVIDGKTGSITDKVKVGKDPSGIAVDQNSDKIYVVNFESKSISVIETGQSNKLVDTIKLKGISGNPDFILLNEVSDLLYIKSVFTGSSSGSYPVFYSSINVLDINKREITNSLSMSSNDWEGIAYNSENNSIYIREPKTRSVLKYDQFAKEKLASIQFDTTPDSESLDTKSKTTLLGRLQQWLIDFISTGWEGEREAITVNPLTNKVYVSDRSRNLLWEIDA